MDTAASIAEPAAARGLIVMVRRQPKDAARAMADDLDAELIIGSEATRDALGRLSPSNHGTATGHGPLAPCRAAMERTERARAATRAAAADRIAAALSTRLSIHPETVRRAAQELLAARHALDARVPDSRAPNNRRRSRPAPTRPFGIVAGALAAVGVASAGAAVGHVLVSAGAAVASLALAALLATSSRRARRARATSDLGAHHSSEAESALRVAERRWVQLAGHGTDPTAVEEVIQRYEPQQHVVAKLVEEHPAVRAVERAAMVRHNDWVTAGRESDQDGVQLWLSAEAPLPGPATVVVASPYAGLSEASACDLRRSLMAVAVERRVIVVLDPDSGASSGSGAPEADRAAVPLRVS